MCTYKTDNHCDSDVYTTYASIISPREEISYDNNSFYNHYYFSVSSSLGQFLKQRSELVWETAIFCDKMFIVTLHADLLEY